jgi:hypothetical protein
MISFCLSMTLTLLVAVQSRPHFSQATMSPEVSLGVPLSPIAMGQFNMPAHGHLALAMNPCPRPYDQYGPRFSQIRGTFLFRHETAGGGRFVVIKSQSAAAPQSETITDEVFDTLGSVQPGTLIILFSYATPSLSSAQSPYSCVELSDVSAP